MRFMHINKKAATTFSTRVHVVPSTGLTYSHIQSYTQQRSTRYSSHSIPVLDDHKVRNFEDWTLYDAGFAAQVEAGLERAR